MSKRKITGTPDKPRLVVFRSLNQMNAQLVDDTAQKVICGISDNTKEFAKDIAKGKTKTERANIIGKKIAEKATALKIDKVVFDRNGYIYKGRVKAVAEGARDGGLKF